MEKYILSLDQGTTSSRAILFDKAGQILAIAQKEFTQYFPKPGWVEHDPAEIWSSQAGVAAEVIAKAGITTAQIHAIGITNQRETTIVWDRQSGEPVYPAIVWQDRRTAPICEQWKSDGLTDTVRAKTGLVIDAYFSASKIRWILDNVNGARARAEAGQLAFGTVDAWLVWKFTRGKVHATDVTNAGRTMLFNIVTLQWDDELLTAMKIPRSLLPEVKENSALFGETADAVFSSSIPVAGMAGDQHAALFGQMCLEKGMVKNTYGTGCFMLMNIGDRFIASQNRLITTLAWKYNGQVNYAFEGSIFIAGAVVQWIRDGLGLIRTAAEIEMLAGQVADNGGVYFVPAFAGLGAPHWNADARGTIVGLTRGSTAGHIARASVEAIAYQTADVLSAMEADAGTGIRELRVDGGATANNMLMQFQSDVSNCRVIRPAVTETTALGAAFFAGLTTGFWSGTAEISRLWKTEKVFSPSGDSKEIHRAGWKKAITAARAFTD